MSRELILDGMSLTLDTLFVEGRLPDKISLAPDVAERCAASRAVVEKAVADGQVVYGVTTGFGKLANVRIPDEDLKQLQANLIMSHAAGVGDPLPDDVARLIVLLKANNLARGLSGVRREAVDSLVALYNTGAAPIIPCQGSVGASGDLAPLAHLGLLLLGNREGKLWWNDEYLAADDFLKQAGLTPLVLEAKEGLSIINGTQVSTALASIAWMRAARLCEVADLACALSVDAFRGSRIAFDPRIHAARGQLGQQQVAAQIWHLLEGSEILDSHADCDRVQDPYSFRCAPQVQGAVRDTLNFAASFLERELNAVSDNPLVFAETDEVLSGGNFHAEPVAFAADVLAIALTELASISERRTAQLIDTAASGLPAFLVEGSGLNSGFMIAHVTAAALVSEMKTLAHPAVVDSIPTSAGKEDHVSMATWAGRKALQAAECATQVLAIELLAASQGIDLLRPLTTSAALEALHAQMRDRVAPWETDRVFAPDIALIAEWIREGYTH